MADVQKIPAIEIIVDGKVFHPITSKVFSGKKEEIEAKVGSIAFIDGALQICDEEEKWIALASKEEVLNEDGTLDEKIVIAPDAVKFDGEDGEKITLVEKLERVNAAIVTAGEAVDTAKKELEEKIEEVTPKVENLETQLGKKGEGEEASTGIVKDIEDLGKQISALDTEVDETISEKVSSVKEEMEASIKEKVGEVDTRVTANEEAIVANKEATTKEIEEAKEVINAEVAKKVDTVNGKAAVKGAIILDAEDIELSEEEDIKTAIEAIREAAKKEGVDREAAIKVVADDLTALAKRHDEEVETIVGDVIANMTDEETADAYKTLKQITADLVENEASVKDLLAQIEANNKADKALQESVTKMDERLKIAEESLGSVASDEVVGGHTKQIKALQNDKADKTALEPLAVKEEVTAAIKVVEDKIAPAVEVEKTAREEAVTSLTKVVEGKAEKEHVHENYVEKTVYDEKVKALEASIAENAKLKAEITKLEERMPELDEEAGTLVFKTK